MVAYIIVALIIVYTVFVIYKKVKDIKKGKFCDCGCSSCSQNCPSKEDEAKN